MTGNTKALLNVAMAAGVVLLFFVNVGLALIALAACALIAFELNKKRG